ncbi:uncharacterized protein T551_01641 [Pneumocystis jirovecii RU7]|uniref:Uncharacterized protein n=1 Tax=Pneumocystis jirovecii (strain RU7) TaxID=1408657 RepID=A0A0W4ZRT8_PNEJ7|nr:uncharacterized protein T551_01641 [Pneumocystis jirovecii RU7]KTW31089.1 hypothetical protein T551_01641 [Pneumocystis jirovecii RU7]
MDEKKEFVGFFGEEYYDSYDFEWFNDNEKEKKKMTEAEFIEQKNAWRPKIEDKHTFSKISIPIPRPANKFSLAELKSAAEEQYYLRNYQLSLNYVNDLLKPKNSNFPTDCNLHGAEKKEMEYLRDMCLKRLSLA